MPKCSALYNHECLSLNGKRLPCCRFENPDPSYTVLNSTVTEYLNSDFINNIKSEMEDGWHLGCIKCKNEEESNLTSLRNLYNKDHTFGPNIESIEFSLNNNCNLACRMCGPRFSTKWVELIESNSSLKKFVDNVTDNNSFDLHNIFYPERNLDDLKFIKYLGGEPFITKEIKDLFEILDKRNKLENISFFCSTNGTLFPKKYLKYLNKFKIVRLHISLDGVDELNDYIRYGKSWNSILSVIKKWKEYATIHKNIKLSIFTTVQAYNIHHINNLQQLAKQLDIDFRGALLNSPSYLSINALPPEYIEKIKDESNEMYLKNYSFNKEDFMKLKEYTLIFDNASKTHCKNIIPDLWKELIK